MEKVEISSADYAGEGLISRLREESLVLYHGEASTKVNEVEVSRPS